MASGAVETDIVERAFALIEDHYRARPERRFRPGIDRVPVGYAVYGSEETNAVLRVLLSGWISMGPETDKFERAFASYVGAAAGVGVNSGSSANLLALATLLDMGRLRKGDEVILPAATFTTVLSPVIQLGLQPVLVDVDLTRYDISPHAVTEAISDRTRAVIVVHTLGQPADLDPILHTAREHGLVVLEDCCEAHGSRYHGRIVGSFGDISSSSFFVAHNMTTGEGGMLLTSDPSIEATARSIREFGRPPRRGLTERYAYDDGILREYDENYVSVRMGFNMRMTDLAAAFGLQQLAKLERTNARRIETAAYYTERLRRYEHALLLPEVAPGDVHTFYAYPIVLRKGADLRRAEFARYLEAAGIETRAFFGGTLADQPAYRDQPMCIVGDLPVSRQLRDQLVFIGCHPAVTDAEREYVCDVIDDFFGRRSARAG